jgi:parallel beta-helix repeat protein
MDQKPKQVTIAEGGHIAYSNQGSTQDQSTPRPTSNPGSTEKPISTPTSTPKPTNKPKPTAEPTQKPNNTPTPTQGPTASPTPTSTPDPDTTPPSVPTNLTGTAVSSAIIRLSWTASTDNVGLVGYCVYRDEKLIGTSTTTSYSDTGLTAGATYSYTVAAYDGVGNVSNKCGAVSITMPLSSGIVYYIDFENGDDANEGTSPESPWKHCPGDSNAVGVAAAASLSPGDTVLFRGGVIYRGMIKTISDGINYRGDAWPAGVKAIIDGSDPFLNEKKPCTQEECGTNPNWSNIVCVDLPETIEKYSDFLMFDESSKLWLAQFPKVPDPFWEDDFSNYRPVSKENITVNSIKDPEFFNQTDPHYWDGAYIMIWINPNSVITQPVTGYDPATGTIYYKELSENAIYGDRDQYFSMINHIDLITQPGEYYVDEASHKMYFWPRDNSELSLVTRSTGFNVVGNNDLVFEGFIIQRLVGGSAVYTRGAWMGSGLISNNLTIRNNEMRWIRKNGSIHTGAITLRKGSGHIIENNYIHDIQRGSGIHVPGEVSDTIIRNNVITRSGYKGIWLMGDQNIQITGNLFYDNKATHGTDVSVFTSKNVLFANNIAYNSKTEMFSFEHDENIFIYNNILLGNGASAGIIRQNGDDMKGILFIAHNTVLYSGNNIGLNCSPSRYEDARYIVKNNILDGWQAESTRYEVSNNIYTGLSWNQKERYGWYLMPGETVENNLHLIFRSPVEEVAPVVVPTDDVVEIYKLKDGSPAIGAGEILNDVIPQEALQLFPNFEFYQDFRGNPRPGDQKGDIGALQYSGK